MNHFGSCPRGTRRGLAAVVAVAIVMLTPAAGTGLSDPPWPPPRLRDTGLYADWPTRAVAAENLPFSPQYALWSDGAAKSRWMRLPKGTFIDASNPDVWRFPVGTRLWKEFRFGRRVETRFMQLTRRGWQFATYEWTADDSDAVLAPELGVRRSVVIREDGVRHAIPSRADCRACHEAGPVRVLGVSALQLSPDRDPNAPHAEAPPPGAVDLAALVARGLVRGLPASMLATPPRIAADTPTARAALGYLQANCGGCHNDAGELKSLVFSLNYAVGKPLRMQRAILTSVGRPSRFKLTADADTVERVCAGQPDKSMVVARMSSRDPLVQMPPLGTRIVDAEAVQLIRRWIAEDLASGLVPSSTDKEK